jgi:hypothetical protein
LTNACSAEGVADEKDDLAVGTKLENFTLPDLSSAEQSLDKLKGENGAFSFEFQRSVWSSKPTTKESTRSLMN